MFEHDALVFILFTQLELDGGSCNETIRKILRMFFIQQSHLTLIYKYKFNANR